MKLYAVGETMTTSRSAFSLIALAYLWTSCVNADAHKVDSSSTNINHQVLSLNLVNNGQHLAATLGQQIEISLGAIAPCDPQVSPLQSGSRVEVSGGGGVLGWKHVVVGYANGAGVIQWQTPFCVTPAAPSCSKRSV
jgi:hypothetical protein